MVVAMAGKDAPIHIGKAVLAAVILPVMIIGTEIIIPELTGLTLQVVHTRLLLQQAIIAPGFIMPHLIWVLPELWTCTLISLLRVQKLLALIIFIMNPLHLPFLLMYCFLLMEAILFPLIYIP